MLEQRGFKGKAMTIATFLLITIAFNKDWGGISVVWWGSVALFCLVMFFSGSQTLILDMPYFKWSVTFFVICAASILWATDTSRVTLILTSMVVHLVLLIFLQSKIKSIEDIHHLMMIIVAACLVNAAYLVFANWDSYLNMNTDDISTANRLGAEGDWNANEIGMMMSFSVVVLIEYLHGAKGYLKKILVFVAIAFLVVVALITGSRKAVIIILLGSSIYLLLTSQGKKIRTALLALLIFIGMYYVIMEVEFFYAIVGWRIEAFIQGVFGTGDMDSSGELRERLIEIAWDSFKEKPILGVGLDCFRLVSGDILGRYYYAHNNYLELLADIGIIGFISYYSGYLYLIKHIWKGAKQDRTRNLLLALMGCVLISEYACVTYSTFLFGLFIMIMFMWVKVKNTRMEVHRANA